MKIVLYFYLICGIIFLLSMIARAIECLWNNDERPNAHWYVTQIAFLPYVALFMGVFYLLYGICYPLRARNWRRFRASA